MYANEDAKIVSEFSEFYSDATFELPGFDPVCQRCNPCVLLDLDSDSEEDNRIVDDFSDYIIDDLSGCVINDFSDCNF
jgi:hypothetical protein